MLNQDTRFLPYWLSGGMGVVCVLVFIPSKSENNKRIAKNTLFLYVRMLFIMESNFCIKHNSL